MSRSLAGCALIALGLAACASTRSVDSASKPNPADHDPRTAFVEADRNRDGWVDRKEFRERQVFYFLVLDEDQDGHLSEQELSQRFFLAEGLEDPNPDSDGDGRISMDEYVQARFRGFDSADTNDDGLLSQAEATRSWSGV
jgi:hypothetical protein